MSKVNMINMTKNGAVLEINPTCQAAHERKGWAVTEQKADPVDEAPADDDEALTKARAEYKELVGKKAHHSWDVAAITAKLSELTE